MSDIWYFGSQDLQASNGSQSPDPVTTSDTSWTWEIDFVTDSDQTTYAKTSLDAFASSGGGWVAGGIVTYTTRDASGIDSQHPVGQGTANGLADNIWDTSVVSVTFGWTIGSPSVFLLGGSFTAGNVNVEIWVT